MKITKVAVRLKDLEMLEFLYLPQGIYCPACFGWEVEKGRGCTPKKHTKNCWLKKAITK